MLILTRKIDDEIIINSEIKIKVLSISDNQVKLGITAPVSVGILRGEIYEKVKQSTIDAVNQSKNKVNDISGFKVNKIGK